MRALVGAILGVLVGTLVVAGLGVAMNNAFWSVLLAGLAAGVVMRMAAAEKGSTYLKGGLAAVATVLAAVIGPLVATEWFRASTNQMKPNPGAVAVAETDEEEGDGSAAVVDIEVTERVDIPGVGNSSGAGLGLSQPTANSFSPVEITCLVVGCLIAYLVGKGGGPPATATADAPQKEEPAAEGEAPEEPA